MSISVVSTCTDQFVCNKAEIYKGFILGLLTDEPLTLLDIGKEINYGISNMTILRYLKSLAKDNLCFLKKRPCGSKGEWVVSLKSFD